MDSSLLVWKIRIQETEALLHKRRSELQQQQQKRAELQQELLQEDARQDDVRQQLAALNSSSEGLTASELLLKRNIAAARDELAKQQTIAGLCSQERLLQQQLERLQAVVGSEQRVQQQYEGSISGYLQDKRSRGRMLQAKAAKVAARLEQLQQQEERLCMDQQLTRLQQQQAALQAELSQFAKTLTSSKQANVVARAKVAAATSETTAELQSAQERCAALKGEAFQMGRQQAVNDTRLRQLRQEGGRLQQQCCELDQLLSRAAATIDQLASSCDL
ncbi:hypothetical protein OEZ85_007729 [Tetradesmus obliquus]|uniref:DUF4201 domain-containing protein n=1 Tax=Tetradesmus obliquus TaxID=3088 RepID=A0ABY8TJ06_TETOB|nr:hypothetical protein OEZ85_007729 [Tetradesmus obliquus]